MDKKSWYIWLSILALTLLWGYISFRIQFLKPTATYSDGRQVDTWDLQLRSLGNLFLAAAIIFIPLTLTMLLFPMLVPYLGEHGQTIFETFTLIILYFTGVYATHRLDKWRKKNLLPLSDKYKENNSESLPPQR